MMANKVWFITGASRGFGLLIARDALARGDYVVAAARKPQAVAEALGNHPRLLPVQLDVADDAAASVAVQAAVERFGRVDVLVNNAGYGLVGAVEETSAQELRKNYEVNVFGLLNVSRAVLPVMRRQRSGHVMNISSQGGYQGFCGFGIYCSTKFAVEGLSEAMAQELAPLGVHVTVVEPGAFRTDFFDAASLVKAAAHIEDYDGTVGPMRQFAADNNHAQPGDPEKLAQALLVLADAGRPPLRLQLGSDAVARAYAKHQQVEQELAQWKELALSTDFEPAARQAA
ncbi:oxidoreductase [Pseudoduganella violaceinigra]|uniref:oxidoreductase n=1 Tax=Pseudoduganella violaceinigra TaxID=246602 RepID=UPI00040089EF|nr:oxidoreductase [Pseudoduganella violaceinigra]